MDPATEIERALTGLGVLIVHTCAYDDDAGQVSALCRVDQRFNHAWYAVVDAILEEEELLGAHDDPPWNVHICKFFKRQKGSLGYCWNVMIQVHGEDVDGSIRDICRMLQLFARNVHVFKQRLQAPSPSAQQPAPASQQTRRVRASTVPGTDIEPVVGPSGELLVVPLVGVTAERNKPQAPIMTHGVSGRGRQSGVSSKGAHMTAG